MQIKLINKGNRNQLVCERRDGSFEIADIGPGLPSHDIAHFIIERELKLKQGFYGNIYNGFTIKQLSEKEIIKTLHIESGVSEITTRALQSLSTGACTIEQFADLIYEEFNKFSIIFPLYLTKERILKMFDEYQQLMNRWQDLREGDNIELWLDI